MPTYEYVCPDGHQFERFYRKISDAVSDVTCPVCGKPAERKLSASGFAFKGSGFYLTDYGKNAHRGTGEVVGAGDKGGDGAGGEKTAVKPVEGASKSGDAPSAAAKSESKPSESKASAPSAPSSAPAPKSDK